MSAELVSDEEMDFWSKAALVNISILFVWLFAIKNQCKKWVFSTNTLSNTLSKGCISFIEGTKTSAKKHTELKLCQWPDLVQRSRQPFQTSGAAEHNTARST